MKQDAKESVDDYYKRMMKLASQFEVLPADNFLLSNFRAGLLKYVQVATVGLPRSTLARAKKSAKLAESGLPKESDSTTTERIQTTKRAFCNRCKKPCHFKRDWLLNPESEIGKRRAAANRTAPVAAATPVSSTAESRS